MVGDSLESSGSLSIAAHHEMARSVTNGAESVGPFVLDKTQEALRSKILRRQVGFLVHAYPDRAEAIESLRPEVVAACGAVLPDVIEEHRDGFRPRRRKNLAMHLRRLDMWFSGLSQCQIATAEYVREPTEVGRVRRQFAAAVGQAVPFEMLVSATVAHMQASPPRVQDGALIV